MIQIEEYDVDDGEINESDYGEDLEMADSTSEVPVTGSQGEHLA